MGLSSSKSSSKTAPVYGKQITGAANMVTGAYNQQSPKLSNITDQLAGLVPSVLGDYTKGNTPVQAAERYDGDVLSGKYLNAGNPYLDSMIDQTLDDTRNTTQASLGTRGLAGGSAMMDIVSRNSAEAANRLRYADYDAERARMDAAAGRAPSMTAAKYLPIGVVSDIARSQQLPIQAAAGAGGAIGGLLGNYTTQESKTSPSLGMILAQMAGNAASGWAAGGFK